MNIYCKKKLRRADPPRNRITKDDGMHVHYNMKVHHGNKKGSMTANPSLLKILQVLGDGSYNYFALSAYCPIAADEDYGEKNSQP